MLLRHAEVDQSITYFHVPHSTYERWNVFKFSKRVCPYSLRENPWFSAASRLYGVSTAEKFKSVSFVLPFSSSRQGVIRRWPRLRYVNCCSKHHPPAGTLGTFRLVAIATFGTCKRFVDREKRATIFCLYLERSSMSESPQMYKEALRWRSGSLV